VRACSLGLVGFGFRVRDKVRVSVGDRVGVRVRVHFTFCHTSSRVVPDLFAQSQSFSGSAGLFCQFCGMSVQTENVKKRLDSGMNYVINCDATTIPDVPTAFSHNRAAIDSFRRHLKFIPAEFFSY